MQIDRKTMAECEHLNNIFSFKDKFEYSFDKLFNLDESKTVIKKDNREVKIIKNKSDNKIFYILEKTNQNKKIYSSIIYKEGHEKYWNEKIHESNIFSIKESRLSDEQIKEINTQISLFQENNMDASFLEYFLKRETFSVIDSTPSMYKYLSFIKDLNIIDDNDFFEINETLETKKVNDFRYFEDYLDDWKIRSEAIKNTCILNGYSTKNKAFDNSNHKVWADNNFLYISNENVTICISDLNEKDFSILIFSNDEYITFKELKNKIKKADLNSDGILSIFNEQVKACNLSELEYLSSNIYFVSNIMENIIKPEFPVNINSYEYQKKYHKLEYGFNEADFLAEMFLSSGKYSPENGLFYDDRVVYISKALKQNEEEDNLHLKRFIYCSLYNLEQVTYLNDDWMEGLKKFSTILKNTDLLPKSYFSPILNDENKNIEYIISKVDNKIEELENYKLNNSII